MLPRLACAVAVLAAAACSSPRVAEVRTAAAERASAIEEGLRTASRQLPSGATGQVRVVDEAFVSAQARRPKSGRPLPARFERPDGFVLVRAEPLRIYEIGPLVTEATGIPVSLSRDIFEDGIFTQSFQEDEREELRQEQAAVAFGGGGLTPLPGASGQAGGLTALQQLGRGPQIRAQRATQAAMRANWRGPLSGFLDLVAAHFGLAWEYDGREIRISRFQTRSYTVHALPSSIALATTLSAAPTAGPGAGGGTNQNVSSSVSLQVWNDLQQAVRSIVGNQGRIAASVSTGTIVVTAPRHVLERVDRFMEAQNLRLSRQVALDVQVLGVEFSDGDDWRLDLAGLARDLAALGVELAFGNAASAPAAVGGPRLGVAVTRGNLRGSEAVLQVLSQRGRVSLRTATTVTTLNGIPAPVQVTNTRGYLAEIDVSDVASGIGVGTQRVSLRPGQVTTGFALTVLPRIGDDGRTLLLQFGLGLSELVGPSDGFREFRAPNGAAIQLPDINSRNFVQQAEVPDGGTLLLTGFVQERDSSDEAGAGSPSFFGLGGRQAARQARSALVVMMTPRIVVSRPVISFD